MFYGEFVLLSVSVIGDSYRISAHLPALRYDCNADYGRDCMCLPAVFPRSQTGKSCLEATAVCRQAAGEFPANAGHLQAQAIVC
jgi:hypothetical protein